MKGFFTKFILALLGLFAVLGTYAKDAKACLIPSATQKIHKNITESTPLYLTHAMDLFSTSDNLMTWHYSHESHRSHWSHQSHQSHYSGY
jgi:hypothetical protein